MFAARQMESEQQKHSAPGRAPIPQTGRVSVLERDSAPPSFHGQGAVSALPALTPALILTLQRTAGNAAVNALLRQGNLSYSPTAAATSGRHIGLAQPLQRSNTVALVIQRATEDQITDLYFDAYHALMDSKREADIAQAWRVAFRTLETQYNLARTANDFTGAAVQNAYNALLAAGGAVPPEPAESPHRRAAKLLLAEARARFSAFRGNPHLNRGAWAGSTAHGAQPPDYVRTAAAVVANLRAWQVSLHGRLGEWWLMASDSAPSGAALHRRGDTRGDFIFHL